MWARSWPQQPARVMGMTAGACCQAAEASWPAFLAAVMGAREAGGRTGRARAQSAWTARCQRQHLALHWALSLSVPAAVAGSAWGRLLAGLIMAGLIRLERGAP